MSIHHLLGFNWHPFEGAGIGWLKLLKPTYTPVMIQFDDCAYFIQIGWSKPPTSLKSSHRYGLHGTFKKAGYPPEV